MWGHKSKEPELNYDEPVYTKDPFQKLNVPGHVYHNQEFELISKLNPNSRILKREFQYQDHDFSSKYREQLKAIENNFKQKYPSFKLIEHLIKPSKTSEQVLSDLSLIVTDDNNNQLIIEYAINIFANLNLLSHITKYMMEFNYLGYQFDREVNAHHDKQKDKIEWLRTKAIPEFKIKLDNFIKERQLTKVIRNYEQQYQDLLNQSDAKLINTGLTIGFGNYIIKNLIPLYTPLGQSNKKEHRGITKIYDMYKPKNKLEQLIWLKALRWNTCQYPNENYISIQSNQLLEIIFDNQMNQPTPTANGFQSDFYSTIMNVRYAWTELNERNVALIDEHDNTQNQFTIWDFECNCIRILELTYELELTNAKP